MRKIVITGADGFIGRNLIRGFLKDDCLIYAVVRNRKKSFFKNEKRVRKVLCDLEHIMELHNLINDAGMDVFYHLAWEGSAGALRSDYEKQLANAKYTCDAALESRRLHCKRFISTGTITEKIVPDAINNNYQSENLIYAIAKDTTHNLLNMICKKNHIDYCWVQLSNIFGGDNRNGNLISYTLEEIKAGRVPEYGPCDQYYDFLYINDAIEGLIKIGFSERCRECYFVGSGRPRILREYIELIADKLNERVAIGKRQGDGVIYQREWFDSTQLRMELGFVPYYTFESALDEVLWSYKQR